MNLFVICVLFKVYQLSEEREKNSAMVFTKFVKKKSKRERRRKNIAYILVMILPKLDRKRVGEKLITMSKEDYAHKACCIDPTNLQWLKKYK